MAHTVFLYNIYIHVVKKNIKKGKKDIWLLKKCMETSKALLNFLYVGLVSLLLYTPKSPLDHFTTRSFQIIV